MRSSFLTAKVHFLISVAFIASFGLFATSIMLKAAQMDDPITATIAESVY